MRICFISNEIFAFGKHGGFGQATRVIARELVKQGQEVFAVIPRRGKQKKYEEIDGIKVLGYALNNPFTATSLLVEADAQIYHSEEPSFVSFLAQQAMPHRRHVITFQDTRLFKDWLIEFSQPSKSKFQVIGNILFEDSFFTRISVRRADVLGSPALFLIEKAQRKYNLSGPPIFLPAPVQIPAAVKKSNQPTVVFVGRVDRRKRPELFFDLALHFPQVQFSVVGSGQDTKYVRELYKRYKSIPNLTHYGFIDQFTDPRFSQILSSAWVLVNTSLREGLPNSFLEAAAHQCAILSAVDPDGFATQFGYHVTGDDFRGGLEKILEDNLWKNKGLEGQKYIKKFYWSPTAVAKHLEIYDQLLTLNRSLAQH